jgi:hypothetical protein
LSKEEKKRWLEPMINYKYPTIASGATPIGSAGRAPNEELLWEGRGRKFRIHYRGKHQKINSTFYSHRESGFKNPMILAIAFEVEDWRNWMIEEVREFKKSKIWSLETQPESMTQVESRGLLMRVCPSGTHRLVYQVWPIKEVEKYKNSKIDLETKKEGSNPYSTRTLVNPSLVAYIKPG